MSNAAVEWARKQHLGDPGAKSVLIALAEHHNRHTGQCNPSLPTLAADTDYSERSVRYHLRTLQTLKLIEVELHGGKRSQYNFPALDQPKQSPEPRQSLPGLEEADPGKMQQIAGGNLCQAYKEEPLTRKRTVTSMARKSRQRTPLPPNLQPDLSLAMKVAGISEAEARFQADKFRNYHLSNGNLMADWNAAWRYWCGNINRYGGGGRGGGRSGNGGGERLADVGDDLLGVEKPAEIRIPRGGLPN